jgi:hypothetical protein
MAGRFRRERVPGATVVDGASLGLVSFSGALEVGAYGGLIPDSIATAPSLDRVTVGSCFAVDISTVKGVMVLPRGRVGLVTSSDLQRTRAEAEGKVQVLWENLVAVSGSVRAGLPGDTASPTLDAARLDVDVTPGRALRARLGLRTIGAWTGHLDTGVIADRTTLLWTVNDDLVIGATGALSADVESGDLRGLMGPELSLPRLCGDIGGLSVGTFEEPGSGASPWGRSGDVATTMRPLPERILGLIWSVQGSAFEHADATDIDGKVVFGGALRQLLVMSVVSTPLSPWLGVSGHAHNLFALVDVDGFGAIPVGTVADSPSPPASDAARSRRTFRPPRCLPVMAPGARSYAGFTNRIDAPPVSSLHGHAAGPAPSPRPARGRRRRPRRRLGAHHPR